MVVVSSLVGIYELEPRIAENVVLGVTDLIATPSLAERQQGYLVSINGGFLGKYVL